MLPIIQKWELVRCLWSRIQLSDNKQIAYFLQLVFATCKIMMVLGNIGKAM